MATGSPVVIVGPRASEPATSEHIGHIAHPADFENGGTGECLMSILGTLCRKETNGSNAPNPASAVRQRGEAFLETYEQQVACRQ
jgi:hypothetical protein